MQRRRKAASGFRPGVALIPTAWWSSTQNGRLSAAKVCACPELRLPGRHTRIRQAAKEHSDERAHRTC